MDARERPALGGAGRGDPWLGGDGLSTGAVRRAWAALGHGTWTIERLLRQWQAVLEQEGQWVPACSEGWHPVAVDLTGFWRPRLRGCPNTHYCHAAGKALPAIPVGIVARVGRVGGQHLGVPLALVRAAPTDPRPSTHTRRLIQVAVAVSAPDDALVTDGASASPCFKRRGPGPM